MEGGRGFKGGGGFKVCIFTHFVEFLNFVDSKFGKFLSWIIKLGGLSAS